MGNGEESEKIKLHEINFAKLDPDDFAQLKRIASKHAHDECLPCIFFELDGLDREVIAEELMNVKVIIGEDTDQQPIIFGNPKYVKKGLIKYVSYSDPYDQSTWVKKKEIPYSRIAERGQFNKKMIKLEETITRRKRVAQTTKKVAKKTYAGTKKVVTKAAPVVQKVAVEGAKIAGKGAIATGKSFFSFLDGIGGDEPGD